MGMMILGTLIFVLFVVLAIVMWIIEKVKWLLGISPNKSERDDSPQTKTTSTAEPHRKKIIAEDEGEYVDFEEVK